MTCVVGLATPGGVYIGGDSAASCESDLQVRKESKVFELGELLIGFSSSFRMGQLLRYSLKLPPKDNKDDMRYLTKVMTSVRKLLLRENFGIMDSGEQELGGQLLIGYRNKLYVVDSDFHVGEPIDGYAAIGSGANVALGALFVAKKCLLGPVPAMNLALAASQTFSTNVCGPMRILFKGKWLKAKEC